MQPEEVERILGIFRLADDRGESFERAVQVALTTVLASPQFLFLVEPEETREDRPLTEFELASRLSYFLWSSMPDDELFREAREGTLRANLRRQVVRMLEDPRSDAFVGNFAGQWLQLRKLARGDARTRTSSPASTTPCGRRCGEETERYFAYVLRDDRSVLELLDSDYTFLNEALARHYGIDGRRGRRVPRVLAGRPAAGRRADAGQRPHADVEPEPDVAGEARAVDPPAAPRHAAPAAPARRRQAGREQAGRRRRLACASGWRCTGPTRSARRATGRWTRWASPWRTTTPSAAGGPWTAGSRSTPPAS